MPVEMIERFQKAFGLRVLEGYGLTETSPIACFNHFERPSKPGTVGQPLLGIEIKCFDDDDNEVPHWQPRRDRHSRTQRDEGLLQTPRGDRRGISNGWFHTGDIGVIDDEGYVSIVDRKKDMILRGGYNVYPRELEEVIITHPAVSLCAVIGVPDERLGEEVKAFVVLKQGAEIVGRRIDRVVQRAIRRKQISSLCRISRPSADRRHGQDLQTSIARRGRGVAKTKQG